MPIEHLAVIGPGLLGGSIAMAAQARNTANRIEIWGRSEDKIKVLRQSGFSASVEMGSVVNGADVIILATPVEYMQEVVEQALPFCKKGALITDVGSVKQPPHKVLGSLVSKKSCFYVGSHPMAGSEQAGFEAASAELFQDASCILTNDNGVPEELVTLLKQFWGELGCRVIELSAEEHDQAVAQISHLPHILAGITAKIGLRDENYASLCGGGMRDTSRVAGGDAALWTGILGANKTEVVKELRLAGQEVDKLIGILEEGDEQALHSWLRYAKKLRDMAFVGQTS